MNSKTIFLEEPQDTYYIPYLTLPLEGIDWILKTRYRFSLPLKEGGLTDLGFENIVKKEHLGMVVGVNSWTFFNYSRPSANDYNDRWCQVLVWEFDFWRQKELQVLLHEIAGAYPIQSGDVELLSPDDPFYSEEDSFEYDYVNGHLPNIKESL